MSYCLKRTILFHFLMGVFIFSLMIAYSKKITKKVSINQYDLEWKAKVTLT